MTQRILLELVNGFTIGILIGSAWCLEAKMVIRLLFVLVVVLAAFFVIWTARTITG
jgi:Tfp pilus assembly protein PilO